jgi:hypothetical protein
MPFIKTQAHIVHMQVIASHHSEQPIHWFVDFMFESLVWWRA